jgi:uncharacterized protein (DUF924 family)
LVGAGGHGFLPCVGLIVLALSKRISPEKVILTPMQSQDILSFWFEALTPKQHFIKDAALDAAIGERFGETLDAAARCELFSWRTSAEGRLAEIIVLDQFSRNVYRDTPRAFAQDALALVLAQELVASGADRNLPPAQRAFAYMPYMHSESALVHTQAVALFSQPGMENNLNFEMRHKAIIDRFGRYPHRNAILGRSSSAQELAFISEPGSSF